MASEKFAILSPSDQYLLRMQMTGMDVYLNALGLRLFSEDAKEFDAYTKSVKAKVEAMDPAADNDDEIDALIASMESKMPKLEVGKYGAFPMMLEAMLLQSKQNS